VTDLLYVQRAVLRDWAGDALWSLAESSAPFPSSAYAPLVDRLLKDESALHIFHHTFLSTVPRLALDARVTQTEYAAPLRAMGLPALERVVAPFLRFPLRVVMGLLEVQTDHISHLPPGEFLSVEELTRQLQLSLGFACALKHECVLIRTPSAATATADPQSWAMPEIVDREFDRVALRAAGMLIDLARKLLKQKGRDWFFAETEVLEVHLPLVTDVGRFIYGGTSLVAENMR
jgi:hypothetical protein